MATEIPKFSFLERLSENPSIAFNIQRTKDFASRFTKRYNQLVKRETLAPYTERATGYLETARRFTDLYKKKAEEKLKEQLIRHQSRITATVEKIDNIAHKAIDSVEEKYPIVIEQPEVVGKAILEKRDLVTVACRKPLDPAFRAEKTEQVRELLEPKLAAVLDFIESRFPGEKKVSASHAETQYDRALQIGSRARLTYSAKATDQLRLLREKNPTLEKAAKSAETAAGTASETLSTALPVIRERFSLIAASFLSGFGRVKEITEPTVLRGKERLQSVPLPPSLKVAADTLQAIGQPILADFADVRETEDVSRKDKALEFWRRVKEDHAPRIKKEHLEPAAARAKERAPELKEFLRRESTLLLRRGQAGVEAFKVPVKA